MATMWINGGERHPKKLTVRQGHLLSEISFGLDGRNIDKRNELRANRIHVFILTLTDFPRIEEMGEYRIS